MTERTNEQRRGIGGIDPRAAAWLAWSLWALSVALTALSLLLLALIRSHPGTHIFDWWLGNTLVVIDATVGAIVASRRPENLVGWFLCLSGLAVSTSTFTSQYAIYALLAEPNSLPAGEAMAWIAAWMLPIMIGLQVAYLMLFPTGQIAEQALEMAGVADGGLCLGGGDHCCVLSWSVSGCSWPDTQPTRYRRASPRSTKRLCTP